MVAGTTSLEVQPNLTSLQPILQVMKIKVRMEFIASIDICLGLLQDKRSLTLLYIWGKARQSPLPAVQCIYSLWKFDHEISELGS